VVGLTLFLTAFPVYSADRELSGPVVGQGEEWLGEGADLKLLMEHKIAAGKKGNTQQAVRDLELIMAEAEARDLKEVRLRAQRWWVTFSFEEQPTADLTPAFEELLEGARRLGLMGEEAEILALWSKVLESQGQWLMALKAQDRVTQLALEGGQIPRALSAFLEMSRLCREAGHAWRWRQVWVRVDQVLETRPAVLPDSFKADLVAERQAGAPLLVKSGLADRPSAGMDLQPKESRVLVSSVDRELGRSRFLLTNATAFPSDGTLSVKAEGAGILAWHSEGDTEITISLGKNGGAEETRPLHLLPGQQIEVYVERDAGETKDEVEVVWQGAGGTAKAAGKFFFSAGLPTSSVVNAGEFHLHPGWCIPLYHEIYHRGNRVRLQNLQVKASAGCRLELFDHDTGRLLAVDADGDGSYRSPGDQVLEDADRDGWPDLVIGVEARAIEIFAWPLGITGAGIAVKVALPDGPDGVSTFAENQVHGSAGQ
jgi:hypothetical protein